jgi:hypothetical protein
MTSLSRPTGRTQQIASADIAFHPFADIFPMMDEAALAELAADIKAESQREPIYLWRDQIIDGRNRYAACQIAGVEPVIKRIEFPGGEQEALAYVLSRNLKRRHLNAPQRTEVIRRLRLLPQWRDASNVEIAKQIGVSEATVRRDLSSTHDEDAPQAIENVQPASRTLTVKRGEQAYHMRVEPKPEPAPLTFEDSKRVSDANREKALKEDERHREKVERWSAAVDAAKTEFAKMSTIWRLGFLRSLVGMLNPTELKEFDAWTECRTDA